MSDTPTQAAARLVEITAPLRRWYVMTPDESAYCMEFSYKHEADAWMRDQADYVARKGYVLREHAWPGEKHKLALQVAEALAQQAQELDALRAALRWNDVRTDGPPPCDGEAVFDGINSAGYPGAFNAYHPIDGDCYMETAEGNVHVMGDLRYWRRHLGPHDARKEG